MLFILARLRISAVPKVVSRSIGLVTVLNTFRLSFGLREIEILCQDQSQPWLRGYRLILKVTGCRMFCHCIYESHRYVTGNLMTNLLVCVISVSKELRQRGNFYVSSYTEKTIHLPEHQWHLSVWRCTVQYPREAAKERGKKIVKIIFILRVEKVIEKHHYFRTMISRSHTGWQTNQDKSCNYIENVNVPWIEVNMTDRRAHKKIRRLVISSLFFLNFREIKRTRLLKLCKQLKVIT